MITVSQMAALHLGLVGRQPLAVARVGLEVASQNALTGNRGGGRWLYRKHRDAWIRAFKAAQLPPANGQRRIVRLTREWGKGKRAYDDGNLIGGLKPVVDALTEEIGRGTGVHGVGVIVDDSLRWVTLLHDQRKSDDGCDALVIEVWTA